MGDLSGDLSDDDVGGEDIGRLTALGDEHAALAAVTAMISATVSKCCKCSIYRMSINRFAAVNVPSPDNVTEVMRITP